MIKKKAYRSLCVGIAVLLSVGIFTGCGGTNTAFYGKTDSASGGAVSGSAVSEQAVESQTVSGSAVSIQKENTEKYQFCNKTHLYYCDYDYDENEDGESILTERNLKDFSEKKIYIKRFEQVCFVDEDWVYYLKWANGGNVTSKWSADQLWRAPIEKKKGKKTLNVEKEEWIFTETDGIGNVEYNYPWEYFYCDGRYLLYITSDNYTFKAYDLKKREYVKLSGRKRYDIAEIVVVCGNTPFISFYSGEEGMYRMNLDSGKLIRITDEGVMNTQAVGTEQDLFYQSGIDDEGVICDVWQYRIADGSRQKILVPAQLKKKLIEEDLMDFSKGEAYSYYVSDLFIRGKKLYYQVSLSWMEGETEYQDYVVFRVEPEKTDELIYEKELSELLKNPAENQKAFEKESRSPGGGPFRENVIYRSRGGIIRMTEDSAYCVLYDPQEGKNRLGCYDFATGQMKYFTRKDVEFTRMLYQYGDTLDPDHSYSGYVLYRSLWFLPNNEELQVD